MTEILTESFCERCGTRYTFESARPRVRLKSVKVLSRGLKNFVLSDDTSIEEAMAAARSETDRETTAHQLDAFHKTFNFCLSCRQYTCPNCWNEAEARCLSCAPLSLAETPAKGAGFQVLREAVFLNESDTGNGTADLEPGAWPVLATVPADVWGVESRAEPEPESEVEPIAAAEPEPGESSARVADATAKAVAQTAGLLRRFRPGQSLDAELDAYERERSNAAATGEHAVEPQIPVAEPDAVSAAQVEPLTAESAVTEEPEDLKVAMGEPHGTPVAEEPAAIQQAAPVLEPAFETSTEPGPQPLAAATGADVVEQPTWRITAPDAVGTPSTPAPERDEAVPLQASVTRGELPASEPQWPARPRWPDAARATGLPFLGRPAAPEGGIEALWAASNQELVTASPAPDRASSGIRPCVSCGLSLSASARFCRRCGTLQGG